jgi:hypothetical protein
MAREGGRIGEGVSVSRDALIRGAFATPIDPQGT